jgi:hypothetical protein
MATEEKGWDLADHGNFTCSRNGQVFLLLKKRVYPLPPPQLLYPLDQRINIKLTINVRESISHLAPFKKSIAIHEITN